jgi:hypothetical protein
MLQEVVESEQLGHPTPRTEHYPVTPFQSWMMKNLDLNLLPCLLLRQVWTQGQYFTFAK